MKDMKEKCVCGKEIDERINYCVHCGKVLKEVEVKKESAKKRLKSSKYLPLLEIFRGN